jgi:hypothetical protein
MPVAVNRRATPRRSRLRFSLPLPGTHSRAWSRRRTSFGTNPNTHNEICLQNQISQGAWP